MTIKLTDYNPYDFANRRHIGPSPAEISDMLEVVGAASLDALIDETVPGSIRQKAPLAFGDPMSEREVLDHLRATAKKNKVMLSLIGQGYHGTIMPPVIQRNDSRKPGLVHGLHALPAGDQPGPAGSSLEFPDHGRDLTGLDIANASLLDEATAAAEAMAMAERASKSKRTAFFRRSSLPSADHRRDPHPRRAAGLGGDRRRSVHRTGPGSRLRRASSSIPAHTAMCMISPT
jgi:glycine dehydrogenase